MRRKSRQQKPHSKKKIGKKKLHTVESEAKWTFEPSREIEGCKHSLDFWWHDDEPLRFIEYWICIQDGSLKQRNLDNAVFFCGAVNECPLFGRNPDVPDRAPIVPDREAVFVEGEPARDWLFDWLANVGLIDRVAGKRDPDKRIHPVGER